MIKRTLIFSALMALAANAVQADEKPVFQSGEWRTTTITNITGPINIPTQEFTVTECETQEEFEKGVAFITDEDSCEVLEQTIGDSLVDIRFKCDQDGVITEMHLNAEYDKDSMVGKINGFMEMPIGRLDVSVDLTSERIGDCSS